MEEVTADSGILLAALVAMVILDRAWSCATACHVGGGEHSSSLMVSGSGIH